MKRFKYLLLILFLIPTIVFASDIKQDTIDVSIKADGSATVVETWEVDRQNQNEFQKDFFNLSGVEISNFKIVNENDVELKKVDKLKNSQVNSFSEVKRDNSLSYKMVLDTSNVHTYKITYDVKGIIKKYKDNIYGIDFTFIGVNYKLKINKIYITITSEIPFYETNTALYGIGKSISLSMSDGKILLNAYNYNGKYNIRLVTKFTNVEYSNAISVNKTFDAAYSSIKKENMYLSYIFNTLSKGLVIIIIIIIVLIIILIIVNVILKKKSTKDFPFITTIMNKTVDEYDKVNYYKEVPMVDLYKASFLSTYFNISKNRSDLVGAQLLIWLYQGIIKVNTDGIKPNIELLEKNIEVENPLDKELFLMIKETSAHNKIDGSKLERFSGNHYLRVMEWFNTGVSNVLSNEGKIGSIKKTTKVGKVYLELQETLINDANRLLGLKKYLLNFNQVPRETELTENVYKYLLVYAELFGIGEFVGKEILRKSPDNIFAMQLLQLEKVRYIYKNFYGKAFESYKKITKNAITDISSYTIDFDENIAKKSKK